ncbi:hypothetical protein Tco_1477297 [Tanacetum coccineum]
METYEPADTPMVEKSKLDKDPQGKAVDPTRYRGMIGTLMYLTASRPDLIFIVFMCGRYQAKPTKAHLHALLQMLTMRVAKIPEKVRLVSTGRHLHQVFSTRTTGSSHQKAWNAKHVPEDSKKLADKEEE